MAAFLNDFATEALRNDILTSSLDRVCRQYLLPVAEERLTPEAIEKMRDDPATVEASIMDGDRLIAEIEPGRVMIDLGDRRR